MTRLYFILAFGALTVWLWPRRTRFPPVFIDVAPQQQSVEPREWQYRGHTIKALASYRLQAVVLRSARYRYDREAKLMPVDLALGWGPMSSPKNLGVLDFSQRGRWYHISYRNPPPIPEDQIFGHSANTHMIPANKKIEKALLAIDDGDIIEAEGLLVEAKSTEGWHIRSSLSRTDREGGSCEVVWLEKIRKLAPHQIAPRLAH